MARKQKKNSRSNYLLLGSFLLIIGLAWGIYKLIPRESAEIFVVTSPTEYGYVTLTGVIQKDTAVGVEGNYFLIIPNQKPILLDVKQDSDSFIGQNVTVTGTLYPENPLGQPITMEVLTIEISSDL